MVLLSVGHSEGDEVGRIAPAQKKKGPDAARSPDLQIGPIDPVLRACTYSMTRFGFIRIGRERFQKFG
ncbi:MAG: hypothetical protein DCC65_05665 [Planctomycetota bacterium]|nr:MAG: hypothetical protein DCC65_05665 [Planctomycetota bacterium]